VAGMGTALTPEQAKLLSRYAETVVVAYDGDNAGETAARRALPLLLAEGLGVYRARFPAGEDPDSLRLGSGEPALAGALDAAPDAVSLEIDGLIPPGTTREPRQQAKAAAAVADLLRPIPDPILRFSYGRSAAERLAVPVEMLTRRTGREAPPPEPLAEPGHGRRLVRTLEEQALQRLTCGEESLPAAAELPPVEVFFDPECRNIYQAFCTLYAEGGGAPPRGQAVLAALGSEGRSVDRMASILLESSVGPEKGARLFESLEKLVHRWQERRLRDLASAIRDAERGGQDTASLERLYDEKRRLSLAHHRSSQRGIRPEAVREAL
jgi:hypothetical protein